MGDDHQIPVPAEPPRKFHFKYTVQKGFFQQSEDSTNDHDFDFKKSNFGLIDRSYDTDKSGDEELPWKRFERYVEHLQSTAKENESYKVLFLGRHGQGWHNVAETKYGTKAWDCYWSALDGADNITWADANLTSEGQSQALAVHQLWKTQLANGIPAPQTHYVSPLTRTIETADLTFSNLAPPRDRPYKPYIVELLREALGVHTCDRRSTRAHIARTFPHVAFEPGFEEEDVLWDAEYREPDSARRYRLAICLDGVFGGGDGGGGGDGATWVSLTSHSGAIASVLEELGHRRFALETGGVIPVLVKSERVLGEREVPPKEPSVGPPMCTEPPVDV